MVTILTDAFADNQSVLYVVKQDRHRRARIRHLMQYAVTTCREAGEVWLSNDRQGTALVLFPDRKKTTGQAILRDLRLAVSATGLRQVYRTLRREARIHALHPNTPFCHLWFVGVHPSSQGQGVGSQLLRSLTEHYDTMQRPIYLETSTVRNLPWYQKHGFTVYHELNFSYPLYLMRRYTIHDRND